MQLFQRQLIDKFYLPIHLFTELGFEIIQHLKERDAKQRIPKSLPYNFLLYPINVSYKKVIHLSGIEIFSLREDSTPSLLRYKVPENKYKSLYSSRKGLNIIT